MSVPTSSHLDRPHSDGPRVRRKRPAPPRALDELVSLGLEDEDSDSDDKFFVPTYLGKSVYMQRLQGEYVAKVRANSAAKLAKGKDASTAGPRADASSLPTGSYRGLSHSIIERQPSQTNDDGTTALAPLPFKWNEFDRHAGIEIESKTTLRHRPQQVYQERERDVEAAAVRANHFVPPQCGIYYYEIVVLEGRKDDTMVAIGFSTRTATLSRPIGWEPESYGYHGDDGLIFSGQAAGKRYGERFNKGDVVGAGINFKTNTIFYTLNGKMLGIAFHDAVRHKIYPAISLKRPGEKIVANFGQDEFVFNIEGMMEVERSRIEAEIANTDTSKLAPDMPESDLLQSLVLQFLQHDGYVDTARAFATEINEEKQAMRQESDPSVEEVTATDNEDAVNRQRIRKAILDGDIGIAIEVTQRFYPRVLKENKQVYFKLRCRCFVEMVRKNAELRRRHTSQSKSNGCSDSSSHKMEIDQTGDQEGVSISEDPPMMDVEMLEYGQRLQAEFGDSNLTSSSTAILNELWSLMAYEDPLSEPHLDYLTNNDGRVSVAEELNVAILSSLGKSQRAALEKVYGQTSALLDELRKDGGEGAFISVDDLVDEIPLFGNMT